ncbi:hypothetical protein ACF1AB_39395 [Streptomyces sp. NPDC014846]|uniref:hypothetical protein n=1 Tax=Streptomyces sp. NPDC014846 TaxID=3364922 RepID=UPI0036FC5834
MANDQRSAFAAEIANLARNHKGIGRIEAITRNGYSVLLSGMWGEEDGAIVT